MGFVSLNTALTGIQAGRAGMDTAANNVANANTPGYTRQRVQLAARTSFASPVGAVGTGVAVSDISRARDAFLDARARTNEEATGRLTAQADVLTRAESILSEPEQGLAAELDELWASFEELALRPDDAASRRQALSVLEATAGRVRGILAGWDELAANVTDRLGSAVSRINDLTSQLAQLNRDILDAGSSGTPNALLDRRDAVVDELARLAGAVATREPNGTVRLSLDGLALVSGTRAQRLGIDPATSGLTHPSGLVPVAGGEIAGLQAALTIQIPDLVAQLDTFAGQLATALNDQHALGFDPSGAAGGPLLDASGGARTLRALVTDPEKLAAAGTSPPAPHDGDNAAALASLRTSGIAAGYRAFVAEFGADVASALRVAQSQEQLGSAAASARRSQHGVSIDEEMVAMLSYQRSLEASSRVMTAADEALDILINRTGRVGR